MRKLRSSVLSFALLATVALTPALANAQGAEDIVERATSAFQVGDYETAIGLFEQAFELDAHPVILFNLARAQQEHGDLPAALLTFRTVQSLDAPDRVMNAAAAKEDEVAAALRGQGYDPETVTSATYVPRGDLTLTTQPEGAAVYLDNEFVGYTPFQQSLLDEGVYDLRIQLDGYHPVTQQLQVNGRRSNLRTFNLVPRTSLDEYVPPSPGYLAVTAPAAGMSVYVDGEFVGETPLSGVGFAPGSYILTIESDDWVRYTSTVDIESGGETEVIARMQPLNTRQVVDPHRGRRTAGTALLATGAAVLAGGAAFGVLALNDAADYRDNVDDPNRRSTRDRAQRNALLSDISIGTGAAIFLTGAALRWIVRSPDDVDQDLLVRPTTGPGLGFGLNARW